MMSNPIDDYLMEKEALGPQGVLPGMGQYMKGLGSGAMQNFRTGAEEAIGSGAVGLAATGIGVVALKMVQAVKKRGDFKAMLTHNPDLVEFHDQNPTQFNAHYNSLRSLVPAFAGDPILSGSLMRTMSLNPENAGHHLMVALENRSKTGPSLSMEMGPAKFQTKL